MKRFSWPLTQAVCPYVVVVFKLLQSYRLITAPIVAAGINLGYSLTWIVGFLANRSDLQQNGFQAIRKVYNGEPPRPHEFDRVEYVKALHTVSDFIITPIGHRP